MKHIKLITILSLLLCALCILCACKGTGDDPAVSETESGTEAVTSEPSVTLPEETQPDKTETEPEAETVPSVSVELIPNTLTVEGDKVKVNLTIEQKNLTEANTPHLNLWLYDADNKTLDSQSVVLTEGTADYTLTCGADKAQSKMTLVIEAVGSDGTAMETSMIWDTATLKLKNGLPQLTADGVRCVVAAMTIEEKALMVTGTQNVKLEGASGGTYEIPRLGVPSITVNDGPAGVRYGTTIWYPSVINVSSSWDTQLAQEIGVSMAEDALAQDIDIILAPGMNIQKNVLGGRNFEYVSEDPILTALIAAAYTDGIQSKGVGVSLKHFAANNQETARGQISANVTERALREIYLKAFGMVIESSDPYTIMSSYNLVNGQRVATRYDMLTTYLRGECGFDGYVMSDWGSGGTVVEKVNAGNDINMPGNATDPADLMAAYEAGKVDPLMLDAACRNILGVVVRCHAFTNPDQRTRLDYRSHGEQVANAAADTMVLLKNEGSSLPLASGTTVAVFGNGSVKTIYGGAGSGSVSAKTTVSIMDSLKKANGLTVFDAANNPFLGCEEHSPADESKDVEVTEAYAHKCAEGADVAIIVISRGSTEGADRNTLEGDFRLNATEISMITRVSEAFHAQGKKVVVLLNIGSPMEIVSWRDTVDAILWIGYPGERAGTSVAKVLLGEVTPSAKTTISWPTDYNSTPAHRHFPGNASDTTYYEDIYVGYRYYSTFNVTTAYPFGYGLSYTSFEYSDFSVEKQKDGSVIAKVTIKNVGETAGREIAQVYVSKPEATLEQAAYELAGFGKTKLLAPDESETLTIHIPVNALESYDTENSRYIIDKGDYTFFVGGSSLDVRCDRKTLTYAELTVVKDVENIAAPDAKFDYIRKDDYKIPTEGDQKKNLALGKTATDNGHEGDFVAQNALDGDYITRWSGLGTSESTHKFMVDLGEVYEVGEIIITWESLQAPFTLYTSEDGRNFQYIGIFSANDTYANKINLHGDKARYLRVSIPVGGFCSIFEFEVFEATEEDKATHPDDGLGENIAKGKPVTATTHEAAYVKDYAVDGNYDTRWGSLPSGEAWLQVDLETVTSISAINLYLESAWVPYRIEVSTDGEHYETIYKGAKDEVYVTLSDLDAEARFVRLYREGESWFSIIELEVYK
ncbi:MAG: glycoside hydrolase family 3 C-terminal domain-containing protein [Clostridia bacterium]|nr:glycoside hydrolase family 3 C-terminal domain-containing protein [Clostridia bacterium]